MKNYYLLITLICLPFLGQSQDTFSIVAMDPVTGEVGSAGASCVDLGAANIPTDDFLGELFPGVGAINTQAWYHPTNQANARNRMNQGDTPSEIIDWLVANDVSNQPELRQYGIVAKVGNTVESAGHTGVSTDDYKNHITGDTYSIQGNILLGEEVLLDMETSYEANSENLKCKLMAALQGAKRVGADSRCTANGTSSLFAFVKVAQPTDVFGSPSFLLSYRSSANAGIEPIDELQALFNDQTDCEEVLATNNPETSLFTIYPNPASSSITIKDLFSFERQTVNIVTITGKVVFSNTFIGSLQLNISSLEKGIYFINIQDKNNNNTYKWIKN